METCHRPADVVPVSSIMGNQVFYNRLVDALSVRNHQLYERSGHNQFFSTFSAFGAAAGPKRRGDMLAEVMGRAGEQNILYLELMVSPGMWAAAGLSKDMVVQDDLSAMRKHLPDSELDKIVAQTSQGLTEMEKIARSRLKCDTPNPRPGCNVVVRYLAQAIRVFPTPQVFAQLVYAFRLANADERVVGINLVGPEDNPSALQNYSRHMKYIRFAHQSEAPHVGIALHAGELTKGLVPPRRFALSHPRSH